MQAKHASCASTSPRSGDYEHLASFMGRWPALSIFRRYGTLNIQNLLYLQAELAHLEQHLKDLRLERANLLSTEKVDDLAVSWVDLAADDDQTMYELVLEIREKLKDYNEALQQYHAVCNFKKPTTHDAEALRYMLSHPDGGKGFLRSVERDVYDRDNNHTSIDLITLSEDRSHRDLFTSFLADHCTAFYQRYLAGRITRQNPDEEEGGLVVYRDTRLHAISHFIGTLVASILPAGCIFALYFIDHILTRLGAIMGFSALFAFTLAVFTRARPIEIFAATAAFASVQVVFVGTNGGSPPGLAVGN